MNLTEAKTPLQDSLSTTITDNEYPEARLSLLRFRPLYCIHFACSFRQNPPAMNSTPEKKILVYDKKQDQDYKEKNNIFVVASSSARHFLSDSISSWGAEIITS